MIRDELQLELETEIRLVVHAMANEADDAKRSHLRRDLRELVQTLTVLRENRGIAWAIPQWHMQGIITT